MIKKMKKKILIFYAILFMMFFVSSAYSQTPTTSTTTRIAVINTLAFDDEKEGILKYVNALNALEKEFQPARNELQAMANKLETLTKEYNTLLEEANKPNSPISPQTLQTKREEIERLQREAKFKQDDANARYQSRYNAVVGPILQDIMKAMQEYAKQKGYALIFDAAKLDEVNLILAVGDEKIDVTKDFIKFYNSRPASTTTTTPR
jgi:Skp family chaperone for outer membrane proteins